MKPASNGGVNWLIVLLVIVVGAIATFAALPLDTLAPKPIDFILNVQKIVRDAISTLAPYLLVATLGAGVGLAELTSTFSDYAREALASQWGRLMLWVNGLSAVLAYLVVRIYAPDTNPTILLIAVGLGFPAIIRTKFTLAKQFGGDGQGDGD